jgi:hypothetical protein
MYAEGSSNNKFLEIYNGTGSAVDLGNYSISSCSNGCDVFNEFDFPDNITWPASTILADGDVYVIAHPSADASILAEADETFSFLSNGNDAFALTLAGATASTYTIIDIIGDLQGDPGTGWDVAGVTNATAEHTLTRKVSVCGPNATELGSFGTDANNSEWIVTAQDSEWENLGMYTGCTTDPALTITSPANNQEFPSGTTNVNVSIVVQNFNVANGTGDGHIHWTLNGGGTMMKYDTSDEPIVVSDGNSYTVYMELVDNSHTPIAPAVNQTVTFSVANPPPSLPLFEDFSYSDGSLVPNGGWVNFSGTPGDLLVSSGQAVVQHGVPSEDAGLEFVPVSGNVYYALDFSVDDLGAPYSGTDFEYFAMFKDGGFNFAARLDVVAPTGGGDFSVGIASDEGTADAVWNTDLFYGVTYRAVVRYDQDANIAELWIDPSVSTDTSILGEDRADPGDNISQIALRQSDSSENETVRVDNLKVGETFEAVVSGVLGVEDKLIEDFHFSPNPTALGFVNISSKSQSVMMVNVFDLLGKNVISRIVTNNKLDVSGLNPGIYMMRVSQDKATITKKLVIQ